MNGIEVITLALVFSPLAGALVAGLGAKKIGERGAHLITTLLVLCFFLCCVHLG